MNLWPKRTPVAPYNLPLLRKIRDWVAVQMEIPWEAREFNMSRWRYDWTADDWTADDWTADGYGAKTCGTTYCIAGYVAEITPGVKWTGYDTVLGVDGRAVSLPVFAGEQLGLTGAEGVTLFYGVDELALGKLDALIAKAEWEELGEHAR